jgi:hypothetical protein
MLQLTATTACKAGLGAVIIVLVHSFSLGVCQFELSTSFSKVVEGFVFTRLQLCCLIPTQAVSAQHSIPLSPDRGEIFPSFIWLPILSKGCTI